MNSFVDLTVLGKPEHLKEFLPAVESLLPPGACRDREMEDRIHFPRQRDRAMTADDGWDTAKPGPIKRPHMNEDAKHAAGAIANQRVRKLAESSGSLPVARPREARKIDSCY